MANVSRNDCSESVSPVGRNDAPQGTASEKFSQAESVEVPKSIGAELVNEANREESVFECWSKSISTDSSIDA